MKKVIITAIIVIILATAGGALVKSTIRSLDARTKTVNTLIDRIK